MSTDPLADLLREHYLWWIDQVAEDEPDDESVDRLRLGLLLGRPVTRAVWPDSGS